MNFKKISVLVLAVLIISVSAVSATDNSTDTLTGNVNGNTATDIQNAINSASDGDTINLGENKAYNIENDTIEINKKITLTGNNITVTAGSANGAFKIRSTSDVEIDGITFINPIELPDYGTQFSGKAIYTQASNNLLIKDCRFINYAYGLDMYSTSDSTIENCYFNGQTTTVSGFSGSGTKAIQLMGSKNINIKNNTFEGQIFDGLSIASTSSNINIDGNTFINNTFAIFYGGASTQGNKIKNNRFITCGMINRTTEYNVTVGGKEFSGTSTVDIQDLPVIGMQKASNDIEIMGNEFVVKNSNRIIYSEAENTAHGFPSVIGGINITQNTVRKADPDVADSSVTFYQLVVVSSLGINTLGEINIKDNDFLDIPDINDFDLVFQAIQSENHTIYIPSMTAGTKLIINYVKDGRVNIKLSDLSDNGISGESVSYTINGTAKTATTDEYGQIYINDLSGDVRLTATFKGSGKYSRSDIAATLYVAPKTAPAVVKKAVKLTVAKKTFKKKATKKVTATLKDNTGKVIKGKKLTLKVNGKTYKATTNKKGVATFTVKITKKGTFTATTKFGGDSAYKAKTVKSKIIVK